MLSRTGRPTLLLAALLAAAPCALGAQDPSARETASRFLEAIGSGRWDEAGRHLDLQAFEQYVDLFVRRAQQTGTTRPLPTVDDLRRRDPSMPREVAEWQVRQIREAQQRFGDPTPYEFARVSSVSLLRNLRTADAAARWLEARDPRYVLLRQLAEMNCPVPSDADLPRPTRRVLGTVADGESVAYALYKEDVEFGAAPAGGELGVIELRFRQGRWLVQPRGDLLPEVSLGSEPGQCPGSR